MIFSHSSKKPLIYQRRVCWLLMTHSYPPSPENCLQQNMSHLAQAIVGGGGRPTESRLQKACLKEGPAVQPMQSSLQSWLKWDPTKGHFLIQPPQLITVHLTPLSSSASRESGPRQQLASEEMPGYRKLVLVGKGWGWEVCVRVEELEHETSGLIGFCLGPHWALGPT